MLAILVGLIEIGLGLGKLGFVADLLSNEVQVGYMNGLAITIIVGQLPKLFGFSTDADSFLVELKAFVEGLDQTHAATPRARARRPRHAARAPALHQAPAGGPGRGGRGHGRLGGLRPRRPRRRDGRLPPAGIAHALALPWTSAGDVRPLLLAALGITLVSLTDTIATATSFAARRGEEVEPNQEMIGIGAANVAAGFFQGFAVSTSGSRTAVAEQSGAKTQLTGLVGAGLVAVLLLFFNSLLADLPQSALAAVVIAAALSLMNLPLLRRYYEVRRSALGAVPGRHRRGRAARRPAGHRGRDPAGDPPVLPPQLVAARRRPGTPGRDRRVARLERLPRRRRGSRASSSTAGRRRCSSPTAGTFRDADPPARARARAAAGSCCSARPSPTSTSPPPRCSSSSTTS